MCDVKEIKKILSCLPSNVKLMLDTGHLKVSAKTLGFNKFKAIKDLKKFIGGYQLSDNNSHIDLNSQFNKRAWFLKYIDFSKPISVEVYLKNKKEIYKHYKLLNKFNENNKSIKNFLIKENETIKRALFKMSNNMQGICFVTSNKKLKGVITEGDIRKIVKGLSIKNKIAKIYNQNPKFFKYNTPKHLIVKSLNEKI